MALPSLLGAFRRSPTDDGPAIPPPATPPTGAPRRVAAPPPSELRRERRALLQAREERLRDLGGLTLEMFRQDVFNESLLYEQCAEVARLEGRLQELELLLDARRPPAARCECGAPLLWRSRFCSNCGRPTAAHAVVTCAACGHSLAADARFCPGCGSPAGDAERAVAANAEA